MCTNSWPLYVDYSRDECKRILRQLELEAYAGMVSAFRAQGDLNKDKRRILQDLQNALSISSERHRAEVRRATNDETLTTVADNMCGPDVSSEWLVEGKHLAPLLPRLVPQTAFTLTANAMANMQAERNLAMPPPGATANREAMSGVPVTPPSKHATPAPPRPPSPTSNVVVLPSGLSIHIKGGLNTEDEEIHGGKKRRRSSSAENNVVLTRTPGATPRASSTASVQQPPPGMSPMKISTVTKSPGAKSSSSSTLSAQAQATQKVIIVSSAGTSTTSSIMTAPSSLHHHSHQAHAPQQHKAPPTMSIKQQVPQPHSLGHAPMSSSSGAGGMVVARSSLASASANGSGGNTPQHYHHQQQQHHTKTALTYPGPPKPRTRMHHTRLRTAGTGAPSPLTPRSSVAMVMSSSSPHGAPVHPTPASASLPSTPQQQHHQLQQQQQQHHHHHQQSTPTHHLHHQGPSHIHIRPPSGTGNSGIIGGVVGTAAGGGHQAKPTIHIKQEGSMKIITQGMPAGTQGPQSTGKILQPKPSAVVVVTSAGPTSKTSIGQQFSGSGKVLTSMGGGGRLLAAATSRGTPANVVTVNPKTLQFSTIKTSSGASVLSSGGVARMTSSGTGKPSVIVVQKAAAAGMAGRKPAGGGANTATGISSPFEKELVSFLQRQDSTGKQLTPQRGFHTQGGHPKKITVVRRPIDSSDMGGVRVSASSSVTSSSILAELIQSEGGMQGEIKAAGTLSEDSQAVAAIASDKDAEIVIEQQLQNQWVEYDAPGLDQSDPGATTTIKTLTAAETGTIKTLSAASDPGDAIKALLDLRGTQQSSNAQYISTQADIITIDQAGNIIQGVKEGSSQDTAVHVHLSGGRGTGSLGQEILGELDPQTGILYTSTPLDPAAASSLSSSSSTATSIVTAARRVIDTGHISHITHVATGSTVAMATQQQQQQQQQTAVSGTVDFLTSALSQAQINLDQFLEEETPVQQQQQQQQHEQQQQIHIQQEASIQEVQEVVSTTNMATVACPVVATTYSSSAADEAGVSETIVYQTEEEEGAECQVLTQSQLEEQQQAVAVAVETSVMDTSHMRVEDFASQRYSVEGDGSGGGGGGAAGYVVSVTAGDDGGESVRLSKRKRKAPMQPDELTALSQVGGWVRLALGLLTRVWRFRGANKEKGEMNAASWFTRPVDPNDVPDYYHIVKKPMDFGTIKKKLESSQYAEWSEFHEDMMQVRDNCYQYNPEGSEVRKDCDEVFLFYTQEYEKSLLRWQQTHSTSPTSKRLKPASEKSPVRS